MRFILFAFLLSISLSSCIELEEKITLTAKGSGTYQLSLDMGMLSMMGGAEKMPMLEQIKSFPGFIADAINGVAGITDIKTAIDNPKGFFSVSFAFENQGAFKRAMIKLAGLKAGFIMPNYIKVKKHKFVKKDSGRLIKRMAGQGENMSELLNPKFQQMIKVRTIILLPEPAKKVKNPNAIIRDNGKEIVIEGTLEQLFGGMDNGVKIRF